MKEEVIAIKRENVLAVYIAATDEQQKLLELLFGKEIFKPKNVTERIKTFEDAYRELGKKHQFVKEYDAMRRADEVLFGGLSMDIVAYLKLRIICAALNEGWEPEFTENEERWHPWFQFYTQDEINDMNEQDKQGLHFVPIICEYKTGYVGFGIASSYDFHSDTMYFGARLCLKSDALAVYCGIQFANLWADFNLIRYEINKLCPEKEINGTIVRGQENKQVYRKK